MKRTRLSVIGLIAAAGLALTGCGTASTTPASSAPATGADTSLSDVKSAGVLKVGTEGTYKPFTFHANGSGELTGYDVEIINAIAGKLGVKPAFQETQFDAHLRRPGRQTVRRRRQPGVHHGRTQSEVRFLCPLHREHGRDRHQVRQQRHHVLRQPAGQDHGAVA